MLVYIITYMSNKMLEIQSSNSLIMFINNRTRNIFKNDYCRSYRDPKF